MLFPHRFMPFYEADKGKDGEPPEKDGQDSTGQDSDTKDDFDKERAMATISKLREFEKKAKALEKRVAEFEQAEQARKEADMSEAEKQAARLKELEVKAQEAEAAKSAAEARANETLMRTAVLLAAANFHDPKDAWALIDRSKLGVDDAGEVTGAEEAVKKLAEAKPHLLKTQTKTLGTPGGKPRTNNNKQAPASDKPLVHL